MNPKYICSICGQSTYDVDVDYLSGFDHLSCVLEKSLKLRKIQIENWKKWKENNKDYFRQYHSNKKQNDEIN